MRAAFVTAIAALLFGTVTAEAQVVGQRSAVRRSDGKVIESRSAWRPVSGQRHDHNRHHDHGFHDGHGHGHHHHGGHYYPGYYGFGYGSIGVYGRGLSYYRGPATFGGITPPVYVYPPYGGYGYGGYGAGYGPTFGYGTSLTPLAQPPLYNSIQQYRYNNDWARLSAELADRALRNVDDPGPGTGAVPVPSTPEAKIRSARFVAKGDEAFANQNYAKALEHYKTATGIAKDNGAAFFKAGYAFVALGHFSSAIEYFKRGLAVEPAMAANGPTPDELYGDHQLAWTSHLGRVTRWVAEDVRDAQRVFLLGMLLLFDGDTRAAEFLEKAWQLSGGTETAIVTLLKPPQIDNSAAEPPAVPTDEREGVAPQAAEGPLLGAPAEVGNDAADLPVIPEPPQKARSLTSQRPYGQEPLFPLPSEQDDATDDPIPPLPEE